MAELGRTGSWKAHSEARITAPDDIARRLGIEPGDLCVRTSYEFLADGQPGQLSISGEPMAITSGTPIVLSEMGPFAGKGVVERMRSIGLDITNAIEVPRPARTAQETGQPAPHQPRRPDHCHRADVLRRRRARRETADIAVPDTRWEVAYDRARMCWANAAVSSTGTKTAGEVAAPSR